MAPLHVPTWFEEQFEKLCDAIRLAADGQCASAQEVLGELRDDDLREWYVEHAQVVGYVRRRAFGGGVPLNGARASSDSPGGGHISTPKSLVNAVYRRDRFTCRYCGARLIDVEVLKAFEKAVRPGLFPVTRKNASHGASLVFRTTFDHVVPLSVGGTDAADNLVTACYGCNFGKQNYTLEEIGLDDPRRRPPSNSETWDGLLTLRGKLLKHRYHEGRL